MKKINRKYVTRFGHYSYSDVKKIGNTYAVVREDDGMILAIGKELKGYIGDIIYTQYDDSKGIHDGMDYLLKSDLHGIICKFKENDVNDYFLGYYFSE